MQFKANCQRESTDTLEVEHIGTDELYIVCDNERSANVAAVVLSKEDALALASTIINHYKVEQK